MNLVFLLRRADRRLAAQFNDRNKMSVQRLMALSALEALSGSASQAQLSATSGIDTSTLSTMLHVLERDRLVNRKRDATDTRKIFVTLTKKGRAAVEEGRRSMEAAESTVLASIPTSYERGNFLIALRKVGYQ